MIENFSSLISPIDAGAFFVNYWEKKPLLLERKDARFYRGMISGADLEHILSRSDARYPAVRLAKGGGFYPPEAYTRSFKYGDEVFSGIIDVERVEKEYRAGATVVLPALHQTWRPLTALCANIEAYLDHAVHANAYLTPAGVQGFTPHFDGHETFALQIAGTKRWRIFEPLLPLPHRSQVFPLQNDFAAKPILEATLEPGDLLYLPRGYIHAAATAETYSAHVTVGVTVYTWIELASELLQALKRNPGFRRALPPGFARRVDCETGLAEGLKRLLEQLPQETDCGALVESFVKRIRIGRAKGGASFHADVRAGEGVPNASARATKAPER